MVFLPFFLFAEIPELGKSELMGREQLMEVLPNQDICEH